MATSGYTTKESLADSKDTVLAAARIVGEHKGVTIKLFQHERLTHGTGDSWKEAALAQLTAQALSETELFENYQQLSDTPFTITPTYCGIATLITDPVADRISPKTLAQFGVLGGNAMVRKKEKDGLAMLDGFSNSYPGSGSTLSIGVLHSATDEIRSFATEPGEDPLYIVLHARQIHDIATELMAGLGTYPISEGETARVFRNGFRGQINGAMVFEANLITVDSTPNAKGGVFAKKAIVMVEEEIASYAVERKENIGIGANIVYLRASYGFGERQDGWGWEIFSDATQPTS